MHAFIWMGTALRPQRSRLGPGARRISGVSAGTTFGRRSNHIKGRWKKPSFAPPHHSATKCPAVAEARRASGRHERHATVSGALANRNDALCSHANSLSAYSSPLPHSHAIIPGLHVTSLTSPFTSLPGDDPCRARRRNTSRVDRRPPQFCRPAPRAGSPRIPRIARHAEGPPERSWQVDRLRA